MLESMKRVSLLSCIAVSLLLLLPLSAQAQTAAALNAVQERGYWRAASNTARSITGDITLSGDRITINFWTTLISRARDLNGPEVSAIFDTDSNPARTGSLYHLNISAQKKFLKRNSLCGAADVQWMAAFTQGNSLQIAFFSGDKPPVFEFDAIRSSEDLCGTFTYAR
jgi:hypothetical protein